MRRRESEWWGDYWAGGPLSDGLQGHNDTFERDLMDHCLLFEKMELPGFQEMELSTNPKGQDRQGMVFLGRIPGVGVHILGTWAFTPMTVRIIEQHYIFPSEVGSDFHV